MSAQSEQSEQSEFHGDESIREVPKMLQVATPFGTSFVKACAGTYHLQQDIVHGNPLWKRECLGDSDMERWIYSDGTYWSIGGETQKRKGFRQTRAYIKSLEAHGDLLPFEIGCWEWFAGDGYDYVSDNNMSISANTFVVLVNVNMGSSNIVCTNMAGIELTTISLDNSDKTLAELTPCILECTGVSLAAQNFVLNFVLPNRTKPATEEDRMTPLQDLLMLKVADAPADLCSAGIDGRVMAHCPIDELPKTEKDELFCVYSSMILHDSGLDISEEKITMLIKAAGGDVDSFFPALFAKALGTKDVGAMLTFGSGGGGGPAVARGDAGGSGGGGAAAEAKKEEKKVEVEEEEEEMDFDLFG